PLLADEPDEVVVTIEQRAHDDTGQEETRRLTDTLAMRVRPVVLIADDSLDQLDLYELALADRYTIARARSGQETLAVILAERPDVIVLDVLMPVEDGFATCA